MPVRRMQEPELIHAAQPSGESYVSPWLPCPRTRKFTGNTVSV